MDDRYNIVYYGKIIEGFETEEVKRNFASLFKNNSEKIDLFFSGRQIIVKKDLPYEKAQEYVRRFMEQGALCEMEKIEDKRQAEKPSSSSNGAEQDSIEGDETTCPKCGHIQKKTETCANCGIIISKHREKPPKKPSPPPPPHTLSSPEPVQKNSPWRIVLFALGVIAIGAAAFATYMPTILSYRYKLMVFGEENSRKIMPLLKDCRITIPNHWTEMKNLDSEAILQAGNDERKEYMIVLASSFPPPEPSSFFIETANNSEPGSMLEPEKNKPAPRTLDENAKKFTDDFIKTLEGGRVDGLPKSLKINGYKAVRYMIKGARDGLYCSFMHTTIENLSGFHQIIIWTTANKEEQVLPLMEKVTGSYLGNYP